MARMESKNIKCRLCCCELLYPTDARKPLIDDRCPYCGHPIEARNAYPEFNVIYGDFYHVPTVIGLLNTLDVSNSMKQEIMLKLRNKTFRSWDEIFRFVFYQIYGVEKNVYEIKKNNP